MNAAVVEDRQEFLPGGEVAVRVEMPADATLIGASLPMLIGEARQIVIASPEAAEGAADLLRTIKGRAKTLDERRKAMTRPLDEAKQQAMDLFRPALEALAEAERVLKQRLGDWQEGQMREQAEARRKAEERARKERERLAREAAAAEERARKEREAAEAKAAALEAAGKAERAELLREQAEARDIERRAQAEALRAQAEITVAVAPIAAPTLPSGVSTRDNWRAEVTDFAALVQAVAAGYQPLTMLEPNQATLDRMAKALKADLLIPGVKPVAERIVASRGAR